MKKIRNVYALIVIALIFLFNPNANLIDILPDFIAYILLIIAIGSHEEAIPYLSECKSALVKLGLVTLLKIPAFSFMYSNLNTGKDIIPLFTLVFVTLELILLYSAVSNGFAALSYLGERTDCRSVREAFTVGKKRKCSPEQLKALTYIFFLAKGILNVAPEILLLTPEDAAMRKKLAEAYPAVLVLCIFAALIIGIIWLTHITKYVKSVRCGNDLGIAISSLEQKGTPEEISVKEKMKKLLFSLSLLAVSSIFIFDIVIADFGGYNVLPHFIYGILLFMSMYSLTKCNKIRSSLSVATVGYSLSSLLGFFATLRFCENYTYADLRYSEAAKSLYTSVKAFAVVELIFSLFMILCTAYAVLDFIKEHTDVAPSDPAYSKTNEKNHRLTFRGTLPVFVISAVIHVLKCVNVFIKQTSQILHTDANNEGIVASGLPAMDTIIFLACVVYVICCFVKASNLKDELKFKYDKN